MSSNFRAAPRAGGLPLAMLVVAITGCSRAGGAPEKRLAARAPQPSSTAAQTSEAIRPGDDAQLDLAAQLDRLRRAGRFEEFIDGALRAAAAHPQQPELQLLKSEALLASGLASQCEDSARQSATLAADTADMDLAIKALKLWTAARFRQSKPLDDPLVAELLARLPPTDASVRMLQFWRGFLGNRTPYRLESAPDRPVELQVADAERGSIPFELATIQATANGTTMPLVFIDTGAQYTLMTAEAARAAGVVVGDSGTQLIGFRGLTATPGVLETLDLGGLVLYDVPVLVGDSAPLVALDGQMSLGTELMHHLRFHIDYPARRVTAEPAQQVSAKPPASTLWDIPVWTFSQICLARGQLAAGPMARVLVDTGNRSGTFVSYRWARRNIPQLRAATSSLVFRMKIGNMTLEQLDLGSQSLATWPVTDTMPAELDRLNQVDVILGHDLLWPYTLTIDLPRRVFELRPGTSPAAANDDHRQRDDEN